MDGSWTVAAPWHSEFDQRLNSTTNARVPETVTDEQHELSCQWQLDHRPPRYADFSTQYAWIPTRHPSSRHAGRRLAAFDHIDSKVWLERHDECFPGGMFVTVRLVSRCDVLADDYFFCAHDDMTRRCLLSDRTVGVGLAAALLGELVLCCALRVDQGHVEVVEPDLARERLSRALLTNIASEKTVTGVRDWLRYLSHDAYDMVSGRLVRTGLVVRRDVRRLFRTSVVYEPRDENAAVWRSTRLETAMLKRRPLAVDDATLLGIIAATELDARVFPDRSVDPGRYAHYLLRRLRHPIRESLLELIGETKAAVGDAVLSHRA
jgi:hypothetical protein